LPAGLILSAGYNSCLRSLNWFTSFMDGMVQHMLTTDEGR